MGAQSMHYISGTFAQSYSRAALFVVDCTVNTHACIWRYTCYFKRKDVFEHPLGMQTSVEMPKVALPRGYGRSRGHAHFRGGLNCSRRLLKITSYGNTRR